jgi:YebC/PmpR family DNA-binding regulatory protein
MSGHSKWSTIKHKKAATDAKRSKVFTQMARIITVAAQGGGDPESNFMLRMAIDQARAVNVPNDNIVRAIKRGTGELKDGAQIQTLVYEAMGPGGVAMIVVCATDNVNRTISEVKTALKKNDGKFVSGGGVLHQFAHVAQIVVTASGDEEAEEIELAAIDAGADDVEVEVDGDEKTVVIIAQIAQFQTVRTAVENLGDVKFAQIVYLPVQKIALNDDALEKYQKLYEALDELDDVSEVFDNLER